MKVRRRKKKKTTTKKKKTEKNMKNNLKNMTPMNENLIRNIKSLAIIFL